MNPATPHPNLADAWCATRLGADALDAYAAPLLRDATRRSLVTLALLALIMQLGALLFCLTYGRSLTAHAAFVSTHGLLAALSAHVALSARWVRQIDALNLLGMALLVVSGVGLMLLAHRTGSFDATLMVGVALLFVAMPIMPWGLRESTTVIAIVYVALTASSLSVSGRFSAETLLTLQFLIVAAAGTAMVATIRNVCLRKDDLRSRFELEGARAELERLCNVDPLTGALNRRFLDSHFDQLAEGCRRDGRTLEFILLDIDLFKQHNDTFGHHVGDQVLIVMVEILRRYLPGDAYVVRLGGDEFAVLFAGGELRAMVELCLEHVRTDPGLVAALGGRAVSVSLGFASASASDIGDIGALYQAADTALYIAKNNSRQAPPQAVETA